MQHYVQYHNPDLIKRSVEEVARYEDFAIGTNKKTVNMVGARVWLIGGEGRPRSYSLCYTFVADRVAEEPDDHFRYTVSGSAGRRFLPPYALGQEPWFPDFLRYMANFSLGLRKIPEIFVRELEKIASKNTGVPGDS